MILTLTKTPQNVDQGTNSLCGYNGTAETPAPTGPLLVACGKAPCAEHGTLCAYHGDEPDRCPWCHVTWRTILRRDGHSCETFAVWRGPERKWRVATATEMCQRAHETEFEPGESTYCSHLDQGAGDGSSPAGPRLSSQAAAA